MKYSLFNKFNNIDEYSFGIEPKDLSSDVILNESHIEAIKNTLRTRKFHLLYTAIMTLLLFSAGLYVFISSIITGADYDLLSLLFFTIFFGIIAFIGILPIIEFNRIRKYDFTRAKYGTIDSIYMNRKVSGIGDDRQTTTTYHMNVTFPDRSYITKIKCTRKDYRNAEEGDSVIVISYDGKTAYGVPVSTEN